MQGTTTLSSFYSVIPLNLLRPNIIRYEFDVCLSKRREENQLDATEWFISLIICSTCFGHLYAHHQELETILVLWPHTVCNALVAGGRLLGAEQQAMRPG